MMIEIDRIAFYLFKKEKENFYKSINLIIPELHYTFFVVNKKKFY